MLRIDRDKSEKKFTSKIHVIGVYSSIYATQFKLPEMRERERDDGKERLGNTERDQRQFYANQIQSIQKLRKSQITG